MNRLGIERSVNVYNHSPTPTATAQTMAEMNRTIDGALWLRQRWVNVLPMSPIIPVKTPTAMNHWGNICIILPLSAGAPRAALIIANVTVPIKEAAVASVHSTQTTVADSAARVSCPVATPVVHRHCWQRCEYALLSASEPTAIYFGKRRVFSFAFSYS